MISPRYRIAIATYGGDVVDWLGGVVPIDVVASRDLPALTPSDSSNAFAAFSWAQQVLAAEPGDSECPAPLIYHFTDGHFTGDDPEPVAHEIMTMANSDGAVLVQHFYLGDDMTTKRISDVFTWPGIATSGELKSAHALKLFGMSSVYPKTFIDAMQEKGYNLRFGCRMLLPGHDIDLAELNFVMSGSTPTDLARRN